MRTTKIMTRTTRFLILVVLLLPTFRSNFATLITEKKEFIIFTFKKSPQRQGPTWPIWGIFSPWRTPWAPPRTPRSPSLTRGRCQNTPRCAAADWPGAGHVTVTSPAPRGTRSPPPPGPEMNVINGPWLIRDFFL